jgi:hypothetical protein
MLIVSFVRVKGGGEGKKKIWVKHSKSCLSSSYVRQGVGVLRARAAGCRGYSLAFRIWFVLFYAFNAFSGLQRALT